MGEPWFDPWEPADEEGWDYVDIQRDLREENQKLRKENEKMKKEIEKLKKQLLKIKNNNIKRNVPRKSVKTQ